MLLQLISVLFFFSCGGNSESSTFTPDQTSKKQIVVDVRTVEEWNNDGHADCTVNIPLNTLSERIDELKKYNEVVLVCRSGNRAENAKHTLEQAGIKNVINKGRWQNIACK